MTTILVFVGSSSGCTAAINFSTVQCSTDADCYGRGGPWAGYKCGPDKVCVPVEGYCSTNRECNERGQGDTYICKKSALPGENRCVNLIGPGCTDLIADKADLLEDDAVVIGIVVMPSWTPILNDGLLGAKLAQRDWQQLNNGLVPRPGGGRRPLVLLSCEVPIAKQSQHTAMSDHLVTEVSPPVIVGFLTVEQISYGVRLAQDKDVLLLDPFDAAGATDIGAGLLYTTATPREMSARADNEIVKIHEGQLRAAGVSRDLKLTILYSSAQDSERAAALQRNLASNGKTLQENGPNITTVDYGTTDPQLASATVSIEAAPPDILVCYGGPCVTAISTFEGDGLKMRYGITQNSFAVENIFLNAPEADYERVLGTRDGRAESDPRVARFFQRMKQVFGGDATSEPILGATVYDTVFKAALAISALGDAPVTGSNIARIIDERFVPGGTKVATSDADLSGALDELRAGHKLELDGTNVTAMYGPNRSPLYIEQAIWCLRPGGHRDSGYLWRSDTGLFGTPDCL